MCVSDETRQVACCCSRKGGGVESPLKSLQVFYIRYFMTYKVLFWLSKLRPVWIVRIVRMP
jgi:hypothetical protein